MSSASSTWWLSIPHSQGCLLWRVLHFNPARDFSICLRDGVLPVLFGNPAPPQLMGIPAAVSCSSSAVCLSKWVSAQLHLTLVPIWARGAASLDWLQIPCRPQSDWNTYLFVTSFYHLFYYTWHFLWLGFISRFPILFHWPTGLSLFQSKILLYYAVIYPGEENGTPTQYSCLDNPMDWGVLWAAVHGVAKSQTWLSN